MPVRPVDIDGGHEPARRVGVVCKVLSYSSLLDFSV